MDKPNGVCWTVTKESKEYMYFLEMDEALFLHDPSEDINTEVDFYDR